LNALTLCSRAGVAVIAGTPQGSNYYKLISKVGHSEF
jgi:hypothetical protein